MSANVCVGKLPRYQTTWRQLDGRDTEVSASGAFEETSKGTAKRVPLTVGDVGVFLVRATPLHFTLPAFGGGGQCGPRTNAV